MNVTVTEPTDWSHLTVWPARALKPTTSNLNHQPGQTIPNLVTIKIGEGDRVAVSNHAGNAHVIFDVTGYYDSSLPADAGRFHPVSPYRVEDTRNDGVSLGQGQSMTVRIGGTGSVPTNASAVALNVTVTQPTASSYLTVWPTGDSMPLASNLNFVAGETVPNRVIVGLGGTEGDISIYNASGDVHVIVDVNSWFSAAGSGDTSDGAFASLIPDRIADTRTPSASLRPGDTRTFQVTGLGGAPATAKAVVLNTTITQSTAHSHLTMWPADAVTPDVSDLNYAPGDPERTSSWQRCHPRERCGSATTVDPPT